MRLLSEEDGACFRRLWQYWRNRRDNPMVMYGQIRGRRVGLRVIGIVLVLLSIVLGFLYPLGRLAYDAITFEPTMWLPSPVLLVNAAESKAVLFLLLAGLFLPPLCLSLYGINISREDGLAELDLSAFSREELAFGAIVPAVERLIVLVFPAFLTIASCAVLRPAFGLKDSIASPLVAAVLSLIISGSAGAVCSIWALCIAVRIWPTNRDRSWVTFLTTSAIMLAWVSLLLFLNIACSVMIRALLPRDPSSLFFQPFIPAIIGIVLPAIAITPRVVCGACRNAGSKYFRQVDPEGLQDRSWIANEIAGRRERKQRRVDLAKILQPARPSPIRTLILTMLVLAVLAGFQVFVMRLYHPYAFGQPKPHWFACLALAPMMAFLASALSNKLRGQQSVLLVGGLIPSISHRAERYWLYAAFPTACWIAFWYGVPAWHEPRMIIRIVFCSLAILAAQALLLFLAAVVWHRNGLNIQSVAIWFGVLLAGLGPSASDPLLGMPLFSSSTGSHGWLISFLIELPTSILMAWVYYLFVFRLWDWLQDIHDLHLRGRPRHEIVTLD
ncbi:hypothetical protein KQI84_01340 [bacterium]|nr:hypothetical protein [bacterium]